VSSLDYIATAEDRSCTSVDFALVRAFGLRGCWVLATVELSLCANSGTAQCIKALKGDWTRGTRALRWV
jgi:hypothetical protein